MKSIKPPPSSYYRFKIFPHKMIVKYQKLTGIVLEKGKRTRSRSSNDVYFPANHALSSLSSRATSGSNPCLHTDSCASALCGTYVFHLFSHFRFLWHTSMSRSKFNHILEFMCVIPVHLYIVHVQT